MGESECEKIETQHSGTGEKIKQCFWEARLWGRSLTALNESYARLPQGPDTVENPAPSPALSARRKMSPPVAIRSRFSQFSLFLSPVRVSSLIGLYALQQED